MPWKREQQLAAAGLLAVCDFFERAYNVAALVECQDWTPRGYKLLLKTVMHHLAYAIVEMEKTAVPTCMIDEKNLHETIIETLKAAGKSRVRLTEDYSDDRPED